jgi:uncharacterized membrane protein YdjX (TVP38/TMEM64 family)
MDPAFLKTNAMRIALLAVLVIGVAGFFILGGCNVLTFDRLVENKDALIGLADSHPLLAPIYFVGAYLILGLFGLPGSTMLNITAGVLFDFWKGLFLIIVGSTLASSLAFFSFRYLFRSYVEDKVRSRFPKLEENLEQEGAYFVFSIRLFPVIPFSVTNLVLAVSPVRFFTYLVLTLLAPLPLSYRSELRRRTFQADLRGTAGLACQSPHRTNEDRMAADQTAKRSSLSFDQFSSTRETLRRASSSRSMSSMIGIRVFRAWRL